MISLLLGINFSITFVSLSLPQSFFYEEGNECNVGEVIPSKDKFKCLLVLNIKMMIGNPAILPTKERSESKIEMKVHRRPSSSSSSTSFHH